MPSLRAGAKQSSRLVGKSILNLWIATKILKVLSKTTSPKSKFSRNDGTLNVLKQFSSTVRLVIVITALCFRVEGRASLDYEC